MTDESITERIQQDMTAAMKARDAGTLSTLRMLKAALMEVRTKKAKDAAFSRDEEIEVLQRYAKKRRETIEELRRSISMLRDHFDLAPAVEDYCASFCRRVSLEVEVKINGRPPTLSSSAQLAMFRILQEALTNVHKHAKARKVRVELLSAAPKVCLTIADDGQGFTPDEHFRGHYGLLNMRERARQAGGAITVSSKPGDGCTVTFELAAPTEAFFSQPLPSGSSTPGKSDPK